MTASVASARPSMAARRSNRDDLVLIDGKADHRVQMVTSGSEHLVELLDLLLGTRVTIEEEATGGVRFADPVSHHVVGDVVWDVLAVLNVVALPRVPTALLATGSLEDVPCGDRGDPEVLGNESRVTVCFSCCRRGGRCGQPAAVSVSAAPVGLVQESGTLSLLHPDRSSAACSTASTIPT